MTVALFARGWRHATCKVTLVVAATALIGCGPERDAWLAWTGVTVVDPNAEPPCFFVDYRNRLSTWWEQGLCDDIGNSWLVYLTADGTCLFQDHCENDPTPDPWIVEGEALPEACIAVLVTRTLPLVACDSP